MDGRVYPITTNGVVRDMDPVAIWLWGDLWQSPSGDEPRTLEECAADLLEHAQTIFDESKPAAVWPVDREGNCRCR